MNTIDISRFVSDIPPVIQSSGDFGQVVVNSIPSIQGQNFQNFWDMRSQNSPFYGASNLSDYEIDIQRDGDTTFKGNIKSINADNTSRTANIELRSALQKALERGCIYVSQKGMETPSGAIQNIANLYNIPIDAGSFGVANSIFNADLVYVNINLYEPSMSVMDIFQQIAEIGLLRLYGINGVLYCDTWFSDYAPSIYTFSDNSSNADGITIISHPVVQSNPRETINGYSIDTIVGLIEFGTVENQTKSISGGLDSPVQIMSLQAGVWIGEKWIEYMSTPFDTISFDVPASYGRTIPLGATVTIDYNSRDWVSQDINITAIDNSGKTVTKITGVTT